MTSERPICKNCRQAFLLADDGRQVKRLPFLLQCGHTLCSVCISSKSRRTTDVISCHDCGSKTLFNPAESPDVQLVPDIHTLGHVTAKHLNLKCTPSKSIQEHWSLWNSRQKIPQPESQDGSEQEVEPRCVECNGLAEMKCVQCDEFFCDTCFKVVHAAANILRKHKSIPAYQAAAPLPMCNLHPSNSLAYYCRDEHEALCSDCFIKSHKTHDVVSMEEAAEVHRADLQRLVKDAQSTLEAIKTKKQKLSYQLQEVQRHSSITAQSMVAQMRELYTLLQRRELTLHSELVQTIDQQVAPLLDVDNSLAEDINNVSSVVTRAKQHLKSNFKLLQNTDQLYEALRGVQEMRIRELPVISHNSFVLSPAVKEAINMAGSFPIKSATEPQQQTTKELTRLSNHHTLSPNELKTVPLSRSPSPRSMNSSRRSSYSSRSRSRSHTPVPSATSIKKEDTVGVWVSHVVTPEEFYIQYKDEETILQRVSYQLNEIVNSEPNFAATFILTISEITEDLVICTCEAANFSLKKGRWVVSGMKVAAKFGTGDDEMWYRAEVISCYLDGNPAYVEVFYLDYGNSDNVSMRGLARLPPELKCGPFYAYCCSLTGIQSPLKFSNVAPLSWSSKCITNFKNIVDVEGSLQTEVVMKENRRNIHIRREVDLYTVPIEGPLQSVAIRLVKMGLVARRTQEPVAQWTITSPLPLPQHLEVVVSCCNDPSNFYIQLIRDEKLLKELMKSLQTQNKHKILYTYKGLVCIARSTKKKFRRAVITDVLREEGGKKTIEVRCADYGHLERVNEVWELDPQNTTLPAQAVHCTLENVLPVEDTTWPQEAIKWFKETVTGGPMLVDISGDSTSEPVAVKLFTKTNQVQIQSLMISEGLARYGSPEKPPTTSTKKTKRKNKSYKPLSNPTVIPPTPTDAFPPTTITSISPPIPLRGLKSPVKSINTSSTKPLSSVTPWAIPLVIGSQVDCIVVQVNSPGEFYIQSPTYITQIQPKLAQIPSNQPSRHLWKTGEQCLARFPDRKWYRGEILEKINDNTYRVTYIDFGNCADMQTTDLSILPPSVDEYQPCAVKAALAGVSKTTWDLGVSMYFSSLVLDKHVVATVQALSDSVVDVSLSVDGNDILPMILSLIFPDQQCILYLLAAAQVVL